MEKEYKSLQTFYPYYLTEHRDSRSRLLHFIGTAFFLFALIYAIVQGPLWLLAFGPFAAYSFAWVGHFGFEKNKPATFQYPLYSLASDFIMFWHILTFQLPRKLAEAEKIVAAQESS